MKETRTHQVTGNRFTRADLLSIAEVVIALSSASGDVPGRANHRFRLRTTDGVAYESDDIDIFREGGEVDLKQATDIDFEYWNISRGQSIDISLQNGNGLESTEFMPSAGLADEIS